MDIKRTAEINAKKYNATIEELNFHDNTFSLSKNFNIDEYLHYAEFDEDAEIWIDSTTDEEICGCGVHIVSVVQFDADGPKGAFCFFQRDNTASDIEGDDVNGVIGLWEEGV